MNCLTDVTTVWDNPRFEVLQEVYNLILNYQEVSWGKFLQKFTNDNLL